MPQQGVFPAPSTGQLSAVLDHAPVAICVSAADSRELLYANAQALTPPAPSVRPTV